MAFQLWQGQYRTWSPQHTCLCLLHLNKMIVMEETIFCCYLMFHSKDSLFFHLQFHGFRLAYLQTHSLPWTNRAFFAQLCEQFCDLFLFRRLATSKDSWNSRRLQIKKIWLNYLIPFSLKCSAWKGFGLWIKFSSSPHLR